MDNMTEKEKAIQRALGTLPTFSITMRVDLDAANRQEALGKSREMIKLLREHFSDCTFRKNQMYSTDN